MSRVTKTGSGVIRDEGGELTVNPGVEWLGEIPVNDTVNRNGFVNTMESSIRIRNVTEFFNDGTIGNLPTKVKALYNNWVNRNTRPGNPFNRAYSEGRVYLKIAVVFRLSEDGLNIAALDRRIGAWIRSGNGNGTEVVTDGVFQQVDDGTGLGVYTLAWDSLWRELLEKYKFNRVAYNTETLLHRDMLRVAPIGQRLVERDVDYGPYHQTRGGRFNVGARLFDFYVRFKWIVVPRNSIDPEKLTVVNTPVLGFLPDRNMDQPFQRFGCYVKDESLVGKRIDSFLRRKQSVVMIRNRDKCCFARALTVSLMKEFCKPSTLSEETVHVLNKYGFLEAVMNGESSIKNVTRCVVNGRKSQLRGAIILCKIVGHDWRVPVGFEDIPKWERHLKVHIRMYDGRVKFSKVFDSGSVNRTKLYMVVYRRHCHALLSRKGLVERSYECKDCDVTYQNKDDHARCKKRCYYCRELPCAGGEDRLPNGQWLYCDKCKRSFPNEVCFNSHESKVSTFHGSTICDRIHVCGKKGCKPFDPRKYGEGECHRCTDVLCGNCKMMVDVSVHCCPILPKKTKTPTGEILFFDFECSQESGTHVVTHVVTQTTNGDEVIFTPKADGDFSKVLDDFCEWLFSPRGKEEGGKLTVIAHNGRGYDFQFILRWCVENNVCAKKIIRAGQKIMYMVVLGVRFIDSLSFLTMPLSGFPKTFGLTELAKGFFPHLFNTRANQNYTGVIPEKHYFMPGGMSVACRERFDVWYDQQVTAGDRWCFREEILKYCRSDVDILRRGCVKFQSIFMETAGADPFSYITIAGACMACYRGYYIPENSIYPLKRSLDKWVRRGFFGGRTQVFQANVIADTSVGESIRYVDVMSLYPWVNANCEYPVGPPQFTTYTTPIIDPGLIHEKMKEFGMFEVDVTCPSDLLHPVLPHRSSEGQLLFDLFPKKNAVYTSIELLKAVQLGYVITKIHASCVWGDRSRDLFRGYMMQFLKLKQEASGWGDKLLHGEPVSTDEEKRTWVDQHFMKEGIRLDIDNVEYNAGLRAVSKLCLNSLWGKLGQREKRRKTMFTTDIMEIASILESSTVHDVFEIGGNDVHEVIYTPELKDSDTNASDVPANWTTSAVIAAFTTSHARLKLYESLELVGDRAVYCDTDSIIYVSKDGEPDVPIGDSLGCWTDELDGDYIREFIGAGPKTYSYVTMSGSVSVKCKGFTVSYDNSLSCLTFDNIRKMVYYKYMGEGDEPVTSSTTSHKIVRDKKTKNVLTEYNVKKEFQATLELKGRVVNTQGSIRVLPYGYTGVFI